MTLDEAARDLAEELAELAISVEPGRDEVIVRCEPARIPDVARALRDGRIGFEYFGFMTAADYPPGTEKGGPEGCMDLFYHLRALQAKVSVLIVASIPREGGSVRTLSDIYEGASWHERECYDLFGVVFAGHQDMTRILLPDDWRGHPLRKDYREDQNDLRYTPARQWPEVAVARAPETGAERG